MALSRIEQEVVISFNAEEDTADLYTANPSWMNKLDKLGKTNPGQFRLIETSTCQGKVVSKRYTFPKRFVSIRSKDVKRELTEEQREEISIRLHGSR